MLAARALDEVGPRRLWSVRLVLVQTGLSVGAGFIFLGGLEMTSREQLAVLV